MQAETPEAVALRIRSALRFVPPQRLILWPDYGMTPRRGSWVNMPPATLRSRGRLPRLQELRKRGALPAGPTGRGGPHRRTPAVRRDVMALPNPPRGLCVP